MNHKARLSVFQNIFLVILIGLLVLLVLQQANPLFHYPSRDGGIYAYVGHIILEGKQPYVDAWESKPPGIFYLDAFALWLVRGTRWGIWFVEFVFLFVSALVGYKVMLNLWQPAAAIFGTIVWLFGLNRVLSGGNYTEEYPLLFNFLAIYFFSKSLKRPQNIAWDFLIGSTLGLSFLFRPNTIGVQLSIGVTCFIVLLFRKQFALFVKKIIALGVAAIFVFGAVCICFWAKGSLYPMLEAAFLYNFSYSGAHIDLMSSIVQGFKNLGIVAWIALAGYVCVLVNFIRNIKAKVIDSMLIFLIIGLPIEIMLSALSGRGYGHYFISWMPILALLISYSFFWLAPHLFAPKVHAFLNARALLVLPSLIVMVIFAFWDQMQTYRESLTHILDSGRGVEIISPVARYVRENTDPEDTVLMWGGQAGLNLMAGRDSPTAYFFYPLFVDAPVLSKLENGFWQDITTHPPEIIVDAYIDAPDDVLSLDPETRAIQLANGKGQSYLLDNLDQVFDFVRSHYQIETTIDGYAIYRLEGP